jgi:hypothetical protein
MVDENKPNRLVYTKDEWIEQKIPNRTNPYIKNGRGLLKISRI